MFLTPPLLSCEVGAGAFFACRDDSVASNFSTASGRSLPQINSPVISFPFMICNIGSLIREAFSLDTSAAAARNNDLDWYWTERELSSLSWELQKPRRLMAKSGLLRVTHSCRKKVIERNVNVEETILICLRVVSYPQNYLITIRKIITELQTEASAHRLEMDLATAGSQIDSRSCSRRVGVLVRFFVLFFGFPDYFGGRKLRKIKVGSSSKVQGPNKTENLIEKSRRCLAGCHADPNFPALQR
jgi:hypothetical protein